MNVKFEEEFSQILSDGKIQECVDLYIRYNNMEGEIVHISSFRGNIEIFRKIIEIGWDVNQKYADGMSAMHWSAENDQCDLIKFLANSGASIDIRNNIGQTPLIVSCDADCFDAAKILLLLGADPFIVDNYGYSAERFLHQKSHPDSPVFVYASEVLSMLL